MKIETKKIDFNKRAKPKVNSFGNIRHVPGGGRIKVICSKIFSYVACEVKNNCCLFERLLKVKKNGVFLFGITFFRFYVFVLCK